jgi:ATP synthase subunit 6
MFIFTPLEQFQIIPVCAFRFSIFDFSISNATIIISVCLFVFTAFFYMICDYSLNLRILPSRYQYFIELIFETILTMLVDSVGSRAQKYFPFMLSIFLFVLLANVIGLIPYSFTITSHLVITFALALGTFIGINIICVREHGFHVFSLFLPPGSSLSLAFLLVPIELVSYIFRPISLAVRLFANMMAGHTLLKVIAGFSWSMLLGSGFVFFAHFIPLLILVILMGLELAVACIQAYVFTILSCIYLNDALNLH